MSRHVVITNHFVLDQSIALSLNALLESEFKESIYPTELFVIRAMFIKLLLLLGTKGLLQIFIAYCQLELF